MHATVNSDIQSHAVLNKHKIVFLSSFKNLVSWYIFTQVWYNRLLFKATDSCVAKTDLTPWLTSCFHQQWSAAFSTDCWETLHNWKKRSALPYWTSNAAVLFCRNYFSGLGWIHTDSLVTRSRVKRGTFTLRWGFLVCTHCADAFICWGQKDSPPSQLWRSPLVCKSNEWPNLSLLILVEPS